MVLSNSDLTQELKHALLKTEEDARKSLEKDRAINVAGLERDVAELQSWQ